MNTDQTQARRPKRRQTWSVVAISLALHAAIFLAVGLSVPRPVFRNYSPDQPPITVQLLTPQRERVHRSRRATSQATAVRPARALGLPLPTVHTPRQAPPTVKPSPIPAPATPQPGQAAATAKPGTSIAPAPLPADETPRGVQAMLRRSVGCDFDEAVHLTREEKEACAKRFGEMARKAAPNPFIPDDKRGAYSVQAAADERRRAAREGPMGQPVQPCDGPGSNFGTGCLNEEYKTKVRIP